jgi:hypothetical protein
MAGTYNMVLDQGSDKTYSLILSDENGTVLNLSGYTAKMQVRSDYKSTIVYDELTTENSRITITSALGKVDLVFPNATTELYTFKTGLYDLELYTGSTVKRILEGTFTVKPEVTKASI